MCYTLALYASVCLTDAEHNSCKKVPFMSMAFLMEDPTRSRTQPPSRVATTAVTMVTPPKVRSMDSRPTPNSSCPACTPKET